MDEQSICQNPTIIPAELQAQVRSLVWLARKDESYIKKTLEKYDARALASAWVGPDEILKSLEAALPEKKLRLVRAYKEKMLPSRQSETYRLLVEEGLKDDAA